MSNPWECCVFGYACKERMYRSQLWLHHCIDVASNYSTQVCTPSRQLSSSSRKTSATFLPTPSSSRQTSSPSRQTSSSSRQTSSSSRQLPSMSWQASHLQCKRQWSTQVYHDLVTAENREVAPEQEKLSLECSVLTRKSFFNLHGMAHATF